MINNNQFRTLIVQPTLKKMDLYSIDCENLLVMVMAHESGGGNYIQQVDGPAFGIMQMEGGTFNDIWRRYLLGKHDLEMRLMSSCNLKHIPEPQEMDGNLYLAIAMARVFFLRVYTPIPSELDLLAQYAKRYWNTEAGKATSMDYLSAYLRFIK